MNKNIKRIISLITIIGLGLHFNILQVSAINNSEKLNQLTVSQTEKVGTPITNMHISASCFDSNEDGDNIFYGATGNTVFAYNLDKNQLVDKVTVEKTSALDMGPDGVINIASSGGYYRYNPKTKVLKNYGSISPETAVMHSGCFDSSGNYYFGTFPNAALFKYDIITDSLFKIGTNMVVGDYIKSMASCGDLIFMGALGSLEAAANIRVYNANTGIVSDVPNPIWVEKGIVEGEVKQYYSMTGAGKYLYARFSCFTAKTSWVQGVYDSEAGKWTDFLLGTEHLHSTGLDNEGLSYFRAVGTNGTRTYISYNPQTKEIVNYDGLSSYTGVFISPKALILKDQLNFPGKTVSFGAGDKGIALFNLQNQSMTFIKDQLPQEAFSMRTIKGGYNNDIIASSMASTKLVIYDAKNKIVKKELPLTQMEGINAFDDKYYIGAYGSEGAIREIDPTTGEITYLADMAGYNQNRAFIIENAGDYIIWGTIPGYGYRGGAVGIYNKFTKEKSVYSNFVSDQSIVGLAYKDGYIYGSTTMFCGLGIDPIEDVSKIFKMDVLTGEVVGQVDIFLNTDFNTQYFAGGMTFSKDGRLFMACSQTLVEIDTLDLSIKKEIPIGSKIISSSDFRWQPFALEWGKNGLLYTNIGSVITAVDIDTWESKQLSSYNTSMITLGTDGNLYYMSDSNYFISRLILNGEDWEQPILKSLMVNGKSIPNFNPSKNLYTLYLPTQTAEITAIPNNNETVTITQIGDALPFRSEIRVVSENQKVENKYTIYFYNVTEERAPTTTGIDISFSENTSEKYILNINDSEENSVYNVYVYSGYEVPKNPSIINTTEKNVDITGFLVDLNLEYKIAVCKIVNNVPIMHDEIITLDSKFGGGTGKPNDPYKIYNLRHLNNIKLNPYKAFKQYSNIDKSMNSQIDDFYGMYDGNGKYITINIDNSSNENTGLFSKITNATIDNVTVKGKVKGGNNTGGIIGSAFGNSNITNCTNYAEISATGKNHGGVIGNLSSGIKLNYCKNYGIVSGDMYVGGIAGLQQSLISYCANYGEINGNSVGIGGITGYTYSAISNSFNMGNVTGQKKYVSGIVGIARYGNGLTNCYNLGTITGVTAIGIGRLGNFEGVSIKADNCYNIGKIVSDDGLYKMIDVTTESNAINQTISANNCYYISSSNYNDNIDGTNLVTLKELEKVNLGEGFVSNTEIFRLPQIKDNLQSERFNIYQVNIRNSDNGTVTNAGINYLRDNESLIINAIPDNGHVIEYVRYNNIAIISNQSTEKSVTLTDLTSDVEIAVKFMPSNKNIEIKTYPLLYYENVDGFSGITFGTVSDGRNGYRLKEYGIVFSKIVSNPELNMDDCIKYKTLVDKNSLGQFGIKLVVEEFDKGNTYYTRTYAIYNDVMNKETIIYGDVNLFIINTI